MNDDVFNASEVTEFTRLLLELASKKMPKETYKFIRKEQNLLKRKIRLEAEVIKDKTGKYKRNIDRSRVFNTGDDTIGTVYIRGGRKGAPHAHLIEDGHRIVGHRPTLKDTGRKTAAYKIMEKATENFKKRYMQRCEKFIDKLIKKRGF